MSTIIAPMQARLRPIGKYHRIFQTGMRTLGLEGFIIRNGMLVPVRNFEMDLSNMLAHSVMHEAREEHLREAGPSVPFGEFLNVLVGLTDEGEANALKLIFQNTAWANIGDASGLQPSATAGSFWISLHTADPGETGDQTTNETGYTGYGRVGVARNSSTGWDVSGTNPTYAGNHAAITFGQSSTSSTVTHCGIGTAQTLAGHLVFGGQLGASLAVSNGITPAFQSAGDLKVTLE